MFRTYVICAHTFREAVTQPIFALLLALGAAILGVYATLPFFTLGEDVLMYKAVGLDVVLVVALLLGAFAASRSVHEEIEDRTMLTLMSKPVGRAEVLVGKFLGLLLSAGVAVAVLGGVLAACVWFRVPRDYGLPPDPVELDLVSRLAGLRGQHLAGLWPQLALTWMQVGVLVAVGVLISTRFSLVVNVPATILVYLAGNLTRFVEAAADGAGPIGAAVAAVVNTVLPFLRVFDLTDYTVYAPVLTGAAVAGVVEGAGDPDARTIGFLWRYVAAAGLYFVAYCGFLLCLAALSFRTRDLGGNEG